MNDYINCLTLDLNCNKSAHKICSAQFDKGRVFQISVVSNGENFDISGCTAVLKGVRSDKTHFALECSVKENVATAVIDDTTLSVRGLTIAKLVISDNTKTYSTQTFIIDVDSSLDGNITNDDNFSILNRMLQQMHALNEHGAVLVDDTLDESSENPVQNKVVATLFKNINLRIDNGDGGGSESVLNFDRIEVQGDNVTIDAEANKLYVCTDKISKLTLNLKSESEYVEKKQAYEIIFESGLVVPIVVMNENVKYDNNFIGFNVNQKYHLTIVENMCQVTVIEFSEEQIKQTKLPEGYIALSCIMSNGAAYTRVPIQLTNNSRVVTKYRYCGGPTVPDLFGATDSIRGCKSGFVFGQEAGSSSCLRLNYGNKTTTLGIDTSYNNKIRISDFNKSKLYIDNVLVYEFPEAVFSIPSSYYCLFRYFNGSQDYQIGASSASAIYSQQVYEDDVLVADLIPALSSDGIASFYDTVSGTFLEVMGARTFDGYLFESIEENSQQNTSITNLQSIGGDTVLYETGGGNFSIAKDLANEGSFTYTKIGNLVTIFAKFNVRKKDETNSFATFSGLLYKIKSHFYSTAVGWQRANNASPVWAVSETSVRVQPYNNLSPDVTDLYCTFSYFTD